MLSVAGRKTDYAVCRGQSKAVCLPCRGQTVASVTGAGTENAIFPVCRCCSLILIIIAVRLLEHSMCRSDLEVMQNIIIDTYNATFLSMCIDQKAMISKSLQLTVFTGHYQVNFRYQLLNLRSKSSCRRSYASHSLSFNAQPPHR